MHGGAVLQINVADKGKQTDAGLPESTATVLTGSTPGTLAPAATVAARDFAPGATSHTVTIALPAPDVLTSPKGLEHVGPRAFGYDLDFKSVFAA